MDDALAREQRKHRARYVPGTQPPIRSANPRTYGQSRRWGQFCWRAWNWRIFTSKKAKGERPWPSMGVNVIYNLSDGSPSSSRTTSYPVCYNEKLYEAYLFLPLSFSPSQISYVKGPIAKFIIFQILDTKQAARKAPLELVEPNPHALPYQPSEPRCL